MRQQDWRPSVNQKRSIYQNISDNTDTNVKREAVAVNNLNMSLQTTSLFVPIQKARSYFITDEEERCDVCLCVCE